MFTLNTVPQKAVKVYTVEMGQNSFSNATSFCAPDYYIAEYIALNVIKCIFFEKQFTTQHFLFPQLSAFYGAIDGHHSDVFRLVWLTVYRPNFRYGVPVHFVHYIHERSYFCPKSHNWHLSVLNLLEQTQWSTKTL